MNNTLLCPIFDVAPLLPHSGRMVLLDCIVEYDDSHLVAQTQIRADHILLEDGVLSCLSGLEIMAQIHSNVWFPTKNPNEQVLQRNKPDNQPKPPHPAP